MPMPLALTHQYGGKRPGCVNTSRKNDLIYTDILLYRIRPCPKEGLEFPGKRTEVEKATS